MISFSYELKQAAVFIIHAQSATWNVMLQQVLDMAKRKFFDSLREARKYQKSGFRKEYKEDATYISVILKCHEGKNKGRYMILVPEKMGL